MLPYKKDTSVKITCHVSFCMCHAFIYSQSHLPCFCDTQAQIWQRCLQLAQQQMEFEAFLREQDRNNQLAMQEQATKGKAEETKAIVSFQANLPKNLFSQSDD